jgi:hypothetical protein
MGYILLVWPDVHVGDDHIYLRSHPPAFTSTKLTTSTCVHIHLRSQLRCCMSIIAKHQKTCLRDHAHAAWPPTVYLLLHLQASRQHFILTHPWLSYSINHEADRGPLLRARQRLHVLACS